MRIDGSSTLVTGGASGLGRATAEAISARGGRVVIFDLPESDGESVAAAIGNCAFVPGDVREDAEVAAAVGAAAARGPLRAVVHCAGKGGAMRLVERDGSPGSRETFESVVGINLIGTFNVLRHCAAAMAAQDPVDGERGVCVLTASIAAFEGQIGQIPYASSKGGIVSMTLVAARDLASRQIRVAAIAPGLFDTPILARLPEEVRDSLAAGTPHPSRLGRPAEFAAMALQIVENQMVNGETIRLDGAVRMAPR